VRNRGKKKKRLPSKEKGGFASPVWVGGGRPQGREGQQGEREGRTGHADTPAKPRSCTVDRNLKGGGEHKKRG